MAKELTHSEHQANAAKARWAKLTPEQRKKSQLKGWKTRRAKQKGNP